MRGACSHLLTALLIVALCASTVGGCARPRWLKVPSLARNDRLDQEIAASERTIRVRDESSRLARAASRISGKAAISDGSSDPPQPAADDPPESAVALASHHEAMESLYARQLEAMTAYLEQRAERERQAAQSDTAPTPPVEAEAEVEVEEPRTQDADVRAAPVSRSVPDAERRTAETGSEIQVLEQPRQEDAEPAATVNSSATADIGSHWPTAAPSEPAGNWRRELRAAIESLEADLQDEWTGDLQPSSAAARLRLLYAAQDRRDEAVRPLEGLDGFEQAYWSNQIYGLLVMLDTEQMPLAAHRAAKSLRHLRLATECLASLSALDLRNLAFCEQVESYGVYREFNQYLFVPDQHVLLYVEVENFVAEERPPVAAPLDAFVRRPNSRGPTMYETELQGSYEIQDRGGRRISSHELPIDTQLGRNLRRDYFIAYHIYMPSTIAPGEYRLHLTLEDRKGKKFGHGALDFRIQ